MIHDTLSDAALAAIAARLLVELTPGGSEFANNPENCAAWVRERWRSQHTIILNKSARIQRLTEERDTARAQVATLRATLAQIAVGARLNAAQCAYCDMTAALAAPAAPGEMEE